MSIPIHNDDYSTFDSFVNNYEIVIDETNDTMEKNTLPQNISKLETSPMKTRQNS